MFKKKFTNKLSHRLLILCQMKFSFHFSFCFVNFFLLLFFLSGTHMSLFALLGPFQSQNNLFHPRFSSIYLKWKFFNYLTFLGFSLKFSFCGVHLMPIASNFVKIRLSLNSMKFDWITRFRETNSTVKSVSLSEI